MLSDRGREGRLKTGFPYIGYLLGPRGAAGAGGAVLNIHKAAWFSRALFYLDMHEAARHVAPF